MEKKDVVLDRYLTESSELSLQTLLCNGWSIGVAPITNKTDNL